MSLWTFAMVSVTGDLRALIRLQSMYESFGTPVDTAVGQIQIERRLSAAYLGAGPQGSAAAVAGLTQQQRSTDRAVRAMREAIGDRERREDLSARQRESLDAMTDATDDLEALREKVVSRTISWDRAIEEYTAMLEPTFDVQSTLTALQAGQLAREAQVVVELVRVREFVSRQDALVAGAHAAGRLSDAQYDTLTATIEDRRVFHRTYVPDLPADSRQLFAAFGRSDDYRALVAQEDTLLRAGPAGAGEAMAGDSWRDTTDRAVQRYMLLCTDAAINASDRGRAFAYHEMIKAAVVGVAGLAAVGLSIWFSVASGRRISRRLEELRDAAGLLATRQLPDVMERLAAGEEVDAAAAAPPLDFGDPKRGPDETDEIDQVGQALNAARLAAVEAAVKQSTLRRGIFAVLLNIARRNQALVHRQSKLVDTLERRTSDPDTLDDLFRIDHLTTRMRRHAEGLIILSGAAPGRRWRRPVPVVDIVSAAVGEIEDYARVVVPPMPAVGITADAVADVVHLVAELVENAAVYSPPHTQVTMRTGRVGNGFVLEIDDRGLGMDETALEEARRTLARPGDFDPAQDDRLGLYVVGRLAERHGIGVTLTRSPYGGTTAVVFLPNAVLAAVEQPGRAAEPESAPPPRPRAVRAEDTRRTLEPVPLVHDRAADDPEPAPERTTATTESGARPVPVRDGTVPTPEKAAPVTDAAAASGEKAAASDGDIESGERPPSVPDPTAAPAPTAGPGERPAPVPDPTAAPAPGERPPPVPTAGPGGTAAPVTPLHGLPTRVRQASLAPPLRDAPPSAAGGPDREVSAEEMRSIFGSFQRGLDRGRRGDSVGPEAPSTAPQARTTDEGTDDDG
ncbi:nitrate- and nitrite sensing domain-containing protein [Streptomyces sp. NPDC058685]|uniref:sensor histidine kinase n=1 Tax=Streptomyces sp. NPDC058685 TaxID=3346598 RepID=UPI00366439AC